MTTQIDGEDVKTEGAVALSPAAAKAAMRKRLREIEAGKEKAVEAVLDALSAETKHEAKLAELRAATNTAIESATGFLDVATLATVLGVSVSQLRSRAKK